VTAEVLAASIAGAGQRVRVVKTLDEVVPAVLALVRPGDAVITLGAGSIGSMPGRILDALRAGGRN
jgi:UDP-N-acetylmuramate--alanine ligase